MKVALVLFGIAYKSVYIGPHTGGRVSIDFRRSVDNYRNFIIKPFAADVYLSTNASNMTSELIAAYKPRLFAVDDNVRGRNMHLSRGLSLVERSGLKYDVIIATRFDLLFRVPFRTVHIDPGVMNIVTRLKDGLICDNVYMFPFDKLRSMRQFVSHTRKQSHYWEAELIRIFGRINFLTVDPTWVGGIGFYKIVRARLQM